MTSFGICQGCSTPVTAATNSEWRAAPGDTALAPTPICRACWAAFIAKPPRGHVMPADATCALCHGAISGGEEFPWRLADGAPGIISMLHSACVDERFPSVYRPSPVALITPSCKVRQVRAGDDTRAVGFVIGPAYFDVPARDHVDQVFVAERRDTGRIVAGGCLQGIHRPNDERELAHCVYPRDAYLVAELSVDLSIAPDAAGIPNPCSPRSCAGCSGSASRSWA
jgi:hypothetical protein